MQDWVFLFPGQGSQYIGMGREFYEEYTEVRELFAQANDILGMDVARLCFEGPEDVLIQTANVQPAITVLNLACYSVLQLHEIYPVATAGHSLGEYSALYAAGVLDLKDVLNLVRWRGHFMEEAAKLQPGSMAAIMDIQEDRLQQICTLCDVEVANINCPEQIIITGREEPVAKAMAMSEEAGAKKCVKLNVSGPWHSKCMVLAQDQFEPYIHQCSFKDPVITVVNNVDAQPLKNGAEAAEKLVRQICGSVLWSQSMERLVMEGHGHFVEVGPKKVLRGLMRRINRNVKILNVEDLESLAAFLQANR
jgi:[acyl-carrier-protein] S-malonyltransferase